MQMPASGPRARGSARAVVLGSLTIQGHPSQVRRARAFVTRTLEECHAKVDGDAATLLTSEIVTNAIQHTKSGVDDGAVTIVLLGVTAGVLIEVIDAGSPDVPLVKGDLYASNGHGLFMVQQLAAQWGYLREPSGTTVWFHLPEPGEPAWAAEDDDPTDRLRRVREERAASRDMLRRPPPYASGGPGGRDSGAWIRSADRRTAAI